MTEQHETVDFCRRWLASELQLPLRSVPPSARLVEDLGVDSLDAVALLIQIEEEFEVVIPDATARELRTVADVATAIDSRRVAA